MGTNKTLSIKLKQIDVKITNMQKNSIYASRCSSGNHKVLKDCLGSNGSLIEIITSPILKKSMVKEIRENFGEYFKNEKSKEARYAGALIDLAIFLEVDINNFKNQDLDNIQKVVLDALQKDKADPSWNYLYENDSQVCRILVWKVEKKEIKVLNEKYNTASMTISFRIHDPLKQMIMDRGYFSRKRQLHNRRGNKSDS